MIVSEYRYIRAVIMRKYMSFCLFSEHNRRNRTAWILALRVRPQRV